MQVIIAKEKHEDRIIRAESGVAVAALALLEERVIDDYWYYDEDQVAAAEIVASSDGDAAWAFLYSRRDHEYEWVEVREI